MSNFLDITDLDLTRELVQKFVQNKLGTRPSGDEVPPDKDLQLGGDLIPFLIEQVSIPLIVSLTASTFYDVLKGKALGFLQKHETEKKLKGLLGKELKNGTPLSGKCLVELENLLNPLGFSRDEIFDLYQDLDRRLKEKRLVRLDDAKNKSDNSFNS